MRVALGIEYNGTAYHGWQSQVGVPTVQDHIEAALKVVADQPIRTYCAGRTDAGVHGLAQVAHFDTDVERTERSWLLGCNSNLPKDICVQWVRFVSDEFHARYSAQAREYRYVVYHHPVHPAVWHDRVTWYRYGLDVDLMREACQYLLGEQDFTSFRSVRCQSKTVIRNMFKINIIEDKPNIIFEVKANAFLHNMVRNIVGLLLAIGNGKHPPIWAKQVLEARDRTVADVTAPPHGLYFIAVDYPDKFGVPTGVPEGNILI